MKGTRTDKVLEAVCGEEYKKLDSEGRLAFFNKQPKNFILAVHSEVVREIGKGPYAFVPTDPTYGGELAEILEDSGKLLIEDVKSILDENREDMSFIEPLLLGGGASDTPIDFLTRELSAKLTKVHCEEKDNIFGRDGVSFRCIPQGMKKIESLNIDTLLHEPPCVFGTVIDLLNILLTCSINYTIILMEEVLPLKGELISVIPDDNDNNNDNKTGVKKQDVNVNFAVTADIPNWKDITWDEHKELMKSYYSVLAAMTQFIYRDIYKFINEVVQNWEYKEDFVIYTENSEERSPLTYEDPVEGEVGEQMWLIVCKYGEQVSKMDLVDIGKIIEENKDTEKIEHIFAVRDKVTNEIKKKFQELVLSNFGTADPFKRGEK